MAKKSANDSDLRENAPVSEADEIGAPAASEPASDIEQIESLVKEKDALQDRLLRTAAEFDNYRKRVDRERRELVEYAAAEVLTDLIAIVDDLERALQVPAEGAAESYRQGVELIHKQMLDLLKKRGVRMMDTV